MKLSIIIMIGGFAILLLGGIVTLVVGIRGRRIDNHPICRKCGYDLVGSPESPSKCPECGRELTSRKTLRFGHRKKRPAIIIIGSLLIALTLTTGGYLGWRESRGYDWNQIKPFWLLMLQADGSTDSAHGVQGELFRRMTAKTLSENQIQRLIEHALEVQADPNAIWPSTTFFGSPIKWGDIVERAWKDGEVSESQWQQYVRNAYDVPLQVNVRPRVRAGQSIRIEVDCGIARFSLLGERYPQIDSGFFWANGVLKDVTCGGLAIPMDRPVTFLGMRIGMGKVLMSLTADVPPGRHDLVLPFEFAVRWYANEQRGPHELPAEPDDAEVVRWSRTITVPVEIVTEESILVERVANDALRDQISQRFRLHLGETSVKLHETTYGGRFGVILIDPLPVALGFDVYCRVGDTEEQLGSFASSSGRNKIDNVSFDAIQEDPRSVFPGTDRVDIILRTNPVPAENTLDITEIWDGEIVFEDVPIRLAGADDE